MTPEFKPLHAALVELTRLLEADAPPEICIPKSQVLEDALATLHGAGAGEVYVPGEVAQELMRMRSAMDKYRTAWLARLRPQNATLQ